MMVAPPQAWAETTATSDGTTLTITGGAESSRITIQYSEVPGRYIVREDGAAEVAGAGCAIEFDYLSCDGGRTSAIDLGVRSIVIATGEGDDHVEALAILETLAPSTLSIAIDGGPGNDALGVNLAGRGRIVGGDGDDILRVGTFGGTEVIGDAGNDRLEGGPGADALDGGSGNDTLTGGDGRDALIAGTGSDVVRSRDLTKDRRISCGGGRDHLRSDPFDPRPSRCERQR